MYEESDPDGGSTLSMVWVVSETTNEEMRDPPELPPAPWLAGAARLQLTVVVDQLMSEGLVIESLVRHSWDDSARGPDMVYHGPHPELSEESILEMQLAWEVAMGEAVIDNTGVPRVGSPPDWPDHRPGTAVSPSDRVFRGWRGRRDRHSTRTGG